MAQQPASEEAKGEGVDYLFLLSTDVVAFFFFSSQWQGFRMVEGLDASYRAIS